MTAWPGFLRSAAVLLSGTVLAQGIAFSASLLLARQFDAIAFGHFAAFTGILAILVILATGSYDKALMFAGSRRRFHSLVVVVLALASVLSGAVIVFGGAVLMLGVLPYGPVARFDQVLLLAVASFGFACSQVFVFASLRAGANARVAGAKVGQSAATATAQFGLGVLGIRSGLSIGHALGFALYVPLLWFRLRKEGLRFTRQMLIAARASGRKFASYPRYVCVNEVADAFSQQLPLFLIATLFSIGTLGNYAFAYRLLAGPSALLGQAVSQSFLQRIGGGHVNPTALRRLLVRVWVSLLLIAIVPFGIMAIWGEELFVLLFGAAWSDAGRIAAVSTPLLLARFVSSPTSPIVYRLDLQRQQFFFSILVMVTRSAPIALGMLGATIYQVIAVQSAGEIGVILAFNRTALRALRTLAPREAPVPPSPLRA